MFTIISYAQFEFSKRVHFPEELKEKAQRVQEIIINNKYFDEKLININLNISKIKNVYQVIDIFYVENLLGKTIRIGYKGTPNMNKFYFTSEIQMEDLNSILSNPDAVINVTNWSITSSLDYSNCNNFITESNPIEIKVFQNEFSKILPYITFQNSTKCTGFFNIFREEYLEIYNKDGIYEIIKRKSKTFHADKLLYLYTHNSPEGLYCSVYCNARGYFIYDKNTYVHINFQKDNHEYWHKNISYDIQSVYSIDRQKFTNLTKTLDCSILPNGTLKLNKIECKQLPISEYPKEIIKKSILCKLTDTKTHNTNLFPTTYDFYIQVDYFKKLLTFSKSENLLFIFLTDALLILTEDNPNYMFIYI